jgi:hypothetical protein
MSVFGWKGLDFSYHCLQMDEMGSLYSVLGDGMVLLWLASWLECEEEEEV